MAWYIEPYNLSLGEASPSFVYLPSSDGLANVTWSESVALTTPGGAAIPLRQTHAPGAVVKLNFTGTAVYLCLSSSGLSGMTLVFGIDNQFMATALRDPACAQYGADTLAVAAGLPYGDHAAYVQLLPAGAAVPDEPADAPGGVQFFGGVVTLGRNVTAAEAEPAKGGHPARALAGVGVGVGVALLLLAVLAAYFVRRRCRRRRRHSARTTPAAPAIRAIARLDIPTAAHVDPFLDPPTDSPITPLVLAPLSHPPAARSTSKGLPLSVPFVERAPAPLPSARAVLQSMPTAELVHELNARLQAERPDTDEPPPRYRSKRLRA